MKQLAAIAFSLLLIVAQTFAVAVPVSSKPVAKKPSCCGEDCHCSLSQSGRPSAPPAESAAPAAVQNQFVFLPVTTVAFLLAAPASKVSSVPAAADLQAAAPPLFRRNCSLLL